VSDWLVAGVILGFWAFIPGAYESCIRDMGSFAFTLFVIASSWR
jgi:hypothetical protein